LLRLEREANKALCNDADKAILANIVGQGTGNTSEIWSRTANNAVKQSSDYMVGNVILYIIKPLYYEISENQRERMKLARPGEELVYRVVK
jgi:hypothetical protein